MASTQPLSPEQAELEPGPHAPLDLKHFFTGFNLFRAIGPQGSLIIRQEPRPPKVCKLCSYVQNSFYIFCLLTASSEKYGTEEHLGGVSTYIFSASTGNTILRRHLHSVHPVEYDQAHKLSSESRGASTHDDNSQPWPAAFLEHADEVSSNAQLI